MSYLLDTCILSIWRKIKTHPNKNLEDWFCKHPESSYFISAISVGEIQKGISKITPGPKKMILEDWLFGELIPRFKGRILSIDQDTAVIWGDLSGEAQKKGVNIPIIDGLLAAQSLQHQLVLVTENVKDFKNTGARIFNPMDALEFSITTN
jgi:predicted nucleic acid-binding protein